MFLLLLALVPSFLFIFFVWKQDKIEKEPIGLLIKLFAFGMISCLPAIVFETLLESFFGLFMAENTFLYVFFDNFFGIALVEEGCKFLFLYFFTWKNKNFDYAFDGIIYAVCIGIGFAFLEDILYIMDGELSTAIMRAILSIPGHGTYAILMGHFYSQAKMMHNLGNKARCKSRIIKCLLIPILFHGIYDFCLSIDSILLVLGVLGLEIFLYIKAFKTVKMRSLADRPLPPDRSNQTSS